MAKLNQTDPKVKKGEATSTLNEALLDEFFANVARITIRLTKSDARDKNTDNLTKQEVSNESSSVR